MPTPRQLWDKNHETILAKIKNNDETFTRLNIIYHNTYVKEGSLHYYAVMWYIRKHPNVFEEALRTNIRISSMKVKIANEFSDDYNPDIDYQYYYRGPNQALARAMGAIKYLRHLTIDGQYAFAEEEEYRDDILMDIYVQNVRQISKLHFVLGNECNQVQAHALDQALMNHPNLEVFELKMVEWLDHLPFPFTTSLQTLPKLRKICVSSETDIRNVIHYPRISLPTLSGFPSLGHVPTLREITCTLVELDRPSAISFTRTIENNPNLVSLDVTAPPEVLFFTNTAKAAKRKLATLKLHVFRNMEYPEDGGGYFLEDARSATFALGLSHLLANMHFFGNLKVLSIIDARWEASQLGQFQRMLGEIPCLECLSIRFRDRFNGDVYLSLAMGIGRNSTLKELDLDWWELQDCSDCALSPEEFHRGNSELVKCSTLTSYKFLGTWEGYNCCGVVCDLISLLGVHSSFQKLESQGGNCFHSGEMSKVVDMMQTNYCLTYINMNMNFCNYFKEFNAEAFRLDKTLQVILKLNEKGRRYMVEDRGNKNKGVALLAQLAAEPIDYQFEDWQDANFRYTYSPKEDIRLDCLFFHLRENPSLCDNQHL